jgi:membrane protease YdiL (CAAX protease family)
VAVVRYLALLVLCTFLVIAITAGAVLLLTFLEAGRLDSQTGERIATSALGLSVASGLHIGAIGSLAWWLAGRDSKGRPVPEVLALATPTLRGLGAAVLVGLGTPAVAAWTASVAGPILQLDSGQSDEIAQALTSGPLVLRILLVLIIVLGAPVGEELAFRGGLWDAADRRNRPSFALVVTSVLFALWHVDPLQIVGVTTTAFALGALRLVGGSVVLTIAAHAVHNAVATSLVQFDPGSQALPIGVLGVGAALLALGLRLARGGGGVAVAPSTERGPEEAGRPSPWED